MNSDFTELKYVNLLPRREKARRLLWGLVRLFLFRPTPRWIMHGWRRSLLRMFGALIGSGCRISPTCRVWAPWNLQMGEYSTLGDEVDCYNVAKIKIGSKVTVSQRAFLCCATHDITSLTRPLIYKPITLRDHVWIAAEVMVLPGITINEGAVIGARAVVSKDMPDWTICAGIPCKPIRARTLS